MSKAIIKSRTFKGGLSGYCAVYVDNKKVYTHNWHNMGKHSSLTYNTAESCALDNCILYCRNNNLEWDFENNLDNI